MNAEQGQRTLARTFGWLPRGNTLPYDAWLIRHRWLVTLLAALGVGIFFFALVEGYSVGHSLLEGGLLEMFALAAWVTRERHRLAATVSSVGLVSSASVAVHVSGGFIEAHFVFFVVIILLALYEDWVPFLVAAAYVLIHHGLVGLADPESVYNHPDAIAHPVKWALIHAALVVAGGLAAVVAWRLNEDQRVRTERAYRVARRNERSMADAQELARMGGFECDLVTGSVDYSPQLMRIFGISPDDPLSVERYVARIESSDRPHVEKALELAATNAKPMDLQYRYHHPNGSTRMIHVRAEVAQADGTGPRLIGTSQDVTDRERAREEALRRAEMQRVVAELGELALGATDLEHLFKEAMTTTARVLAVDAVVLAELEPDDQSLVIVAEAGFGDLFGVRYPAGPETQSGYTLKTDHPVVVDDWDTDDRFIRSEVIQRIGARSAVSVVVRGRDGAFGVLGVLSPEANKFGQDDVNFAQSLANVLAAAIERVEAEADVRHRALHDPLTGLPNRVLFLDRLEQAIANAARDAKQVGVLFCDLDQFKLVNDSLGHDAGDELLSMVAPRLGSVLRSGDTVARFGGDEFGLIVAEAESIHDLTRVAERLSAALAAPFVLRDREHFVTASVGIAVGGALDSPQALIRDADLAMYRAKERGRGHYEIFDHLMRNRVVEHLRTENDLRLALTRDELVVHYQPVVAVPSLEVTGFEALARWQHPERGLLGPGEFIPLAEESELIVELGERILQLACNQAAAWHEERPDSPPIGISVNVSPRQMADRGLPDRVASILRASGLDPLSLSLEITESVLVDEIDNAVMAIASLRKLGVKLVLDDFGTGFSALGYLQRFRFDQLKIDRSFVATLDENPATAAIVRSVTSIAEALDLVVVAEGVETAAQLQMIEDLGCHYAQGFYFAKPLPADQAISMHDSHAKIG